MLMTINQIKLGNQIDEDDDFQNRLERLDGIQPCVSCSILYVH